VALRAENFAVASTQSRSPREGLLLFGGVQVLALVSVVVPAGPQRPAWFIAALGLSACAAVLHFATPWRRVPRWFQVAPMLFATAAIGCLIHSATTSTGLGSLLLLPLLFSAFYGARWESYVLIPAIALVQGLIGLSNHDDSLVLTRLLGFWVALLVMISLAAHALRRRLQSTVDDAREEARQSAVVAEATRSLTTSLDPTQVIGAATRLAAHLASSVASTFRRGQYFGVEGETLTILADSDETGMTAAEARLPVREHPMARAVIATGQAVNGPVDLDACGPEVRAILERFGVTHGAYVPISSGGRVTGILTASGRGEAIQPRLFERLRMLGSLTELALANASAHQLLEAQALTDPLTKLANRRELERAFARLPDRLPFAFVAADLDNLKRINDRFGHAAGDEVIVAVASAIVSVARRGDTVARVGGDEFSVLMLDATPDAVERLGSRIHDALRHLNLPGGSPRVSIGGCVASPGSDTGLVQGTADAALYEAKHRGGSRTVVKIFELVAPALIA
jgi:diguanylate cyclase (GGDEF)-like protein